MKECRHCHKILDDSEFSKNAKNSDGLSSYCKKCSALKAKIYNQTKGKEKLAVILKRQIDSGYFLYGHGAYINKKNSAKKRGIQFNITETELKNWWLEHEDKCHYCNCRVEDYLEEKAFILNYNGNNPIILRIKNNVFNTERATKISSMTVDRKDSNKGYEISNMVKSCWICNSLKSNDLDEIQAKKELANIKKIIRKEMNKNGKYN